MAYMIDLNRSKILYWKVDFSFAYKFFFILIILSRRKLPRTEFRNLALSFQMDTSLPQRYLTEHEVYLDQDHRNPSDIVGSNQGHTLQILLFPFLLKKINVMTQFIKLKILYRFRFFN